MMPNARTLSAPQCPCCGTTVVLRGELCPVCKARDWNVAPQATIETAEQKSPAYQRTTKDADE